MEVGPCTSQKCVKDSWAGGSVDIAREAQGEAHDEIHCTYQGQISPLCIMDRIHKPGSRNRERERSLEGRDDGIYGAGWQG